MFGLPDLSSVLPDAQSGKGIIGSILGFVKGHDAVDEGVVVGAMDALLGDGAVGSAIGGATASLLKNAGAPWWLAGIGGLIAGKVASGGGFQNPIMGAVAGLAMLAIVAVGAKMFGSSDKPSPGPQASLAPSH